MMVKGVYVLIFSVLVLGLFSGCVHMSLIANVCGYQLERLGYPDSSMMDLGISTLTESDMQYALRYWTTRGVIFDRDNLKPRYMTKGEDYKPIRDIKETEYRYKYSFVYEAKSFIYLVVPKRFDYWWRGNVETNPYFLVDPHTVKIRVYIDKDTLGQDLYLMDSVQYQDFIFYFYSFHAHYKRPDGREGYHYGRWKSNMMRTGFLWTFLPDMKRVKLDIQWEEHSTGEPNIKKRQIQYYKRRKL